MDAGAAAAARAVDRLDTGDTVGARSDAAVSACASASAAAVNAVEMVCDAVRAASVVVAQAPRSPAAAGALPVDEAAEAEPGMHAGRAPMHAHRAAAAVGNATASVAANRGTASSPSEDASYRVLLVKLGGAAITDKSRYRTLRTDALGYLAAELASVYRQRCADTRDSGRARARLVVVHGAGSFAHFEAKQHRLHSTKPEDAVYKTPPGIAACRASLAVLTAAVVGALTAAGVPAVSVSVFPDGARFHTAVAAAVAAGLVPVLHGDVLLDDTYTTTVLSGDGIVEALCDRLPRIAVGDARFAIERVLFVTGAAGVLTAPPDRPELQPRLIRGVLVNATQQHDGDAVRYVLDDPPSEAAGGIAPAPATHIRHGVAVAGTTLPTSDVTAPPPSGAAGAAFVAAAARISEVDHRAAPDVTGGISAKLDTAVRIVRRAASAPAADAQRVPHSLDSASTTDLVSWSKETHAPAQTVTSIVGVGPAVARCLTDGGCRFEVEGTHVCDARLWTSQCGSE